MLTCCSECPYRGARPRRTLYGPDVWCAHPDNGESLPLAILDEDSARVLCAFTGSEQGSEGAPSARAGQPWDHLSAAAWPPGASAGR